MKPVNQQLNRVFSDLRSGRLEGVAAEPQTKTKFNRGALARWEHKAAHSIENRNSLARGLGNAGLILGVVTGALPLYWAIKGKLTRYVQPVNIAGGRHRAFISQVTHSQWKSLSQFSKGSREAHSHPAKDRILRSNAMKLINNRAQAQELQGLLKQCTTRQLCQLARGIGKERNEYMGGLKYELTWSPAVFEQLREVQRNLRSPLLDEPILQTFDDYEAHKAQAQERVRFEDAAVASQMAPVSAAQAQASAPVLPQLREPLPQPTLKGVRALAAELLLPSNLARANAMLEGGEKGLSATQQLLHEHKDALALMCARPDAAAGAQLPVGLGQALRQVLNLPGPLATQARLTQVQWQDHVQQVQDRIDSMSPEQARELARAMDAVVESFDFAPYSTQLQAVETGMQGPAGAFFNEVFSDYFSHQPAMDQRSMMASLLRQSTPSDTRDDQLAALLKGAGPFMHKVLQLFCDTVKNESTKTALSSVKTGLTPIDRELKAAMLDRIVRDSGGKIEALTGVRTMGAASVGEAVLADVTEPSGPDGQLVSRQVVIKLLRPGIVERAQRERAFFADAASHHAGMGQTFAGIAEQIEAEMNLQSEAGNVQRGQIYNGRAEGLQAMQLSSLVPPQVDYMVVERAPGSPLQKYIDLLEKAARGEHVPMGDTIDPLALGKKAAEQVAELGRVWMNQALAGDGFFHGDLHAGNLMFDGSNGVLTAIDFGNAAAIPSDQRQTTIRIGMALQRGHPRLFEREFRKLLGPSSEGLAWAGRKTLRTEIGAIMRRSDLDEAEKLAEILNGYTKIGIEVPAVISNFSRSMMMLQETLKRLNEANALNYLRATPDSKPLFEHRSQLMAEYRNNPTHERRAELDIQIEDIDKRLSSFDRPKDVSLAQSFGRALRPEAAKLAWRAGLGFTARILRPGVQ